MSSPTVFLTGVFLTLFIAIGTVSYLHGHLHRILVHLCGSDERARFWTAFSTVTLTLVPTIFAMHVRARPSVPGHQEGAPDVSAVFELSGQLEQALIGLVLSLILLAVILNRFITRYEETAGARRLEAKSVAH